MEHEDVRTWVEGYENAWRTEGTTSLPGLFTEDISYVVSPWAAAVEGMDALRELWEAEREGADESFTMTSEVLAVDGDTAVVRAEVYYAEPEAGRWRDLWVLRFDVDGRCRRFEEWPFAPDEPDGHP
ncbi:MAG: nuclear transport factor 2 family protein [Marmoricola sp.]